MLCAFLSWRLWRLAGADGLDMACFASFPLDHSEPLIQSSASALARTYGKTAC
jgi:hypothetical protein